VKRLFQALHEPFKPKTHSTSAGGAIGIGKKRRMEGTEAGAGAGEGISDDALSGLESASMPEPGSGIGEMATYRDEIDATSDS
jgi:hypothetical protein